jgi:hypothetical protein
MKRTKYVVRVHGETARFSSLVHAMQFARDHSASPRFPNWLVEVEGPGGLVGQYQNGKTTAEFQLHHDHAFGA